MIGYKLTTQDKKTRHGFPDETAWDVGVTHTAPGTGELCTASWIHFYTDPFLAMLRNTGDAAIADPRLWEVRAEDTIKRGPLKSGCTRLTIVRELDPPNITVEMRARFATLCAEAAIRSAKKVCTEPSWTAWANNWLSNKDRSGAARVADYTADPAAAAAARAAALVAAYAYATRDDADAAAAVVAARADSTIDFAALAREACDHGNVEVLKKEEPGS